MRQCKILERFSSQDSYTPPAPPGGRAQHLSTSSRHPPFLNPDFNNTDTFADVDPSFKPRPQDINKACRAYDPDFREALQQARS